MRFFPLLLTLTVLQGCHNGDPKPLPVGDACQRAGKNLHDMNCSFAKSSTAVEWSESCERRAGKGYPRMLVVAECVASATTCPGAASCN